MVSKNELNLKLLLETQLSSPIFKQEAYDIYEELRAFHPVYPLSSGEQSQSWLITRYEDAISLLKDAKLMKNIENVFSNKEEVDVPISLENRELLRNHMLNSDPPDHSRLRSLAQKAFTPQMILQLEGRIHHIADTLLSKVEHNQSINLVSDYAFPLPIMVISEMLGIPLEDQHKFRVWSQAIIATPHTLEDMQKNNQKLGEFAEYIQHLVHKKRTNPADDLISALIKAESEGTKLNASELYSTITLLIVAGHETTVNLITNMTLALLEHPIQLQKLRQSPDLINLAIEEALRFYSPVELTTLRWTAEPFTLHGQNIQPKDRIIISLASANRDEKIFPNADVFDITRKNNRHIAFGHGSHFCLGAPLARLEAKIAISTLLLRMPTMQLQGNKEQVRWKENYLMRSLEELPLKF
ncbi:cytochrome P450 [Bacillus mycoides]|uniref:Cytochrome P450 n=1 Tax=Bacillus thuringiensis serovar navarrensis TaxID=339658 RepID=A0A243A0X6_BACTU|nr:MULTISPECIES: cytochrome P450 [Bacillus cereus group]MED1270132.1 cytochrome P450 [Bacillus mycoides]OTY09357.1 cytochrome P450 [Bacillus thuringiensis serovar navarrensis]